MLNLVLVNPPNHRYDVADLAPPLGLLALAAPLIADGIQVTILDFNLESCASPPPESEAFYRAASERVEQCDPNVVCFTSMGINSHVALEIARRVKVRNPHCRTVFGGPHFAAIASELCRRFQWVDFVVVGDGELALRSLVRKMAKGVALTVPQVVGQVETSILSTPPHPWSAYGCIRLEDYFETNRHRILNLETGRGCKYRCRFCYSPGHWLTRGDQKTESVLADFEVAAAKGAKHLFVVQDNFVNDLAQATAVCRAISELSHRPKWNCYVSLPDIDDSLPELMAAAGCTSVYVGFDASTSSQRRVLGKGFTRNRGLSVQKIRRLVSEGIDPTCAFILDALRWPSEELEATFRSAVELRHIGATISLHLLTPYHNTRLGHMKLRSPLLPDSFRTRVMFDCPDVVVENTYAEREPGLFPFHARPVGPYEAYQEAVMLVHIGQELISRYPFELEDLLRAGATTAVDLFRRVSHEVHCENWTAPIGRDLKNRACECFERILQRSYGFVSTSVTI